MQGQQGIVAPAAQAGAAGLGERCGIVGHACTYRVEVDVAHATQKVIGTIDKTGFVAALPERAGAAMARIELADVLAAELLHQATDGTGRGWRGQQVHMVVHQHVGVKLAVGGEQCFVQELPVASAVDIVEEAGQAVVAALHDVLRDAGQVDAG